MKSQVCDSVLAASRSSLGLKNDHRSPKSKARDAVTEEMQVYFSKLKELVPFMPKNKKLSKLEIIQYVIDYICDLQLALETHPAASGTRSPQPSSPVSPNRQPLGVIATPNALPNTCAAQEASHLDKVPTHLDDLSTRPVSC